MWAAIESVIGWINLVISYFQKKDAEQDSADQAELKAELEHQADGAESVAAHDSVDAQNADLDQQAAKLDAPVQAPGVAPTPAPSKQS